MWLLIQARWLGEIEETGESRDHSYGFLLLHPSLEFQGIVFEDWKRGLGYCLSPGEKDEEEGERDARNVVEMVVFIESRVQGRGEMLAG